MSLAKKELHRLVDSLPDRETLAVKRFMEFILARAKTEIPAGHSEVTPKQAALILEMSERRVRHLIREGVIPARKRGSRWVVRTEDLRQIPTADASEFLAHPFAKDDLTDEEKAASDEGWREYLASETRTLSEAVRDLTHEPKA